ncbi:class I SAM-dependent methyltransferase [Caenispirillum bisanense]|uniref:class I SAM-dependent methyltransferase n=1 Tax=Caenispirillum bisanense TaxID=414052 RepID=UPI0031E219AE
MTNLDLVLTQPWPLPLRRLLLEGRQAFRQGRMDLACRRYEEALRIEPNIPEAHLGLALARRPGPDYLAWLKTLHDTLRPALYLEIGVEAGDTLRLAGSGTTAVGIDPAPRIPADRPLPASTRVVAMTSQAFFADARAAASLPGPIDFAFIDGDHRFEAVLRDFIAVEAHMAPTGVIALHDTWPLNPGTATDTRHTGFYTGDGWKLIPCLRAIRPDLRLLTIPAPPTGLTLVTALDPSSTVLRERLGSVLAAYAALPYGPGSERLLALSSNGPAALDQVLAWRAMAAAK